MTELSKESELCIKRQECEHRGLCNAGVCNARLTLRGIGIYVRQAFYHPVERPHIILLTLLTGPQRLP